MLKGRGWFLALMLIKPITNLWTKPVKSEKYDIDYVLPCSCEFWSKHCSQKSIQSMSPSWVEWMVDGKTFSWPPKKQQSSQRNPKVQMHAAFVHDFGGKNIHKYIFTENLFTIPRQAAVVKICLAILVLKWNHKMEHKVCVKDFPCKYLVQI